jgi:hypothetical protein
MVNSMMMSTEKGVNPVELKWPAFANAQFSMSMLLTLLYFCDFLLIQIVMNHNWLLF